MKTSLLRGTSRKANPLWQSLCKTALSATLFLVYSQAGAVTTWFVHNLNDAGAGSLRITIAGAGAGDTIMFDTSLTGTINLNSVLPNINLDLTINGPGPTNLSIVDMSDRVFHITGGNVTITDLRIQGTYTGLNGADGNGNPNDGSPAPTMCGGIAGAGGGAGIFDESPASLTVSNCLFDHCVAKGGNGGNAYLGLTPSLKTPGNGGAGACISGGAIDQTAGDLALINCAFATNSAIGGIGGKGHDGGLGGVGGAADAGAVECEYSSTKFSQINCTFYDNKAIGGQGGLGGDGWASDGAQGGGNGGTGGDAAGGALYIRKGVNSLDDSARCLDSCTVSLNFCDPGIGGAGGAGTNGGLNGVMGAPGTGYGCGLYWTDISVLGVANTIIANNKSETTFTIHGLDVYVDPVPARPITSLGYNLIGMLDADGGTGWGPAGAPTVTDYYGTPASGSIDPRLGPFQYNNSGQTPTMAPEPCSPAVDTGMNVWANAIDQIGQPRTVNLGRFVPSGPGDYTDRGAFEVQSLPSAPRLNIGLLSGGIILTWPASTSTCFVLQESSDLRAWANSVRAVSDAGGVYMVTVPPPLSGNRFFRLFLQW